MQERRPTHQPDSIRPKSPVPVDRPKHLVGFSSHQRRPVPQRPALLLRVRQLGLRLLELVRQIPDHLVLGIDRRHLPHLDLFQVPIDHDLRPAQQADHPQNLLKEIASRLRLPRGFVLIAVSLLTLFQAQLTHFIAPGRDTTN